MLMGRRRGTGGFPDAAGCRGGTFCGRQRSWSLKRPPSRWFADTCQGCNWRHGGTSKGRSLIAMPAAVNCIDDSPDCEVVAAVATLEDIAGIVDVVGVLVALAADKDDTDVDADAVEAAPSINCTVAGDPSLTSVVCALCCPGDKCWR